MTEPSHFFVGSQNRILARWKEAFDRASLVNLSDVSALPEQLGSGIVWLQMSQDQSVGAQMDLVRKQFVMLPCVVLSDRPTESEALAAFAAGARGYANSHCAAIVLLQIAAVILQGGLWIGESLMQRLVGAAAKVLVPEAALASTAKSWNLNLTDRETQVSQTLATGASNREIALALGITERTVKAHIGAVLEKLQVRDRLQLSLIVNGRLSAPRSLSP